MTVLVTMTSADFLPRIRRVIDELRPQQFASDVPPNHAISDATEDATLEQLQSYLALVSDWNTRMDLTAARGQAELVDLFIADAWLLHLALRADLAAVLAGEAPPSCVDVGTGAGAPGFPLKLLSPSLSMTLVEPLTKRVAFLRTAQGTLRLQGMQVRRARSEELKAEEFDIAISRATLNPPEWLAEGARIAKRHVWVLLAKDEPPAHPGWSPDLDVTYRWPITGAERRAVRYSPNT